MFKSGKKGFKHNGKRKKGFDRFDRFDMRWISNDLSLNRGFVSFLKFLLFFSSGIQGRMNHNNNHLFIRTPSFVEKSTVMAVKRTMLEIRPEGKVMVYGREEDMGWRYKRYMDVKDPVVFTHTQMLEFSRVVGVWTTKNGIVGFHQRVMVPEKMFDGNWKALEVLRSKHDRTLYGELPDSQRFVDRVWVEDEESKQQKDKNNSTTTTISGMSSETHGMYFLMRKKRTLEPSLWSLKMEQRHSGVWVWDWTLVKDEYALRHMGVCRLMRVVYHPTSGKIPTKSLVMMESNGMLTGCRLLPPSSFGPFGPIGPIGDGYRSTNDSELVHRVVLSPGVSTTPSIILSMDEKKGVLIFSDGSSKLYITSIKEMTTGTTKGSPIFTVDVDEGGGGKSQEENKRITCVGIEKVVEEMIMMKPCTSLYIYTVLGKEGDVIEWRKVILQRCVETAEDGAIRDTFERIQNVEMVSAVVDNGKGWGEGFHQTNFLGFYEGSSCFFWMRTLRKQTFQQSTFRVQLFLRHPIRNTKYPYYVEGIFHERERDVDITIQPVKGKNVIFEWKGCYLYIWNLEEPLLNAHNYMNMKKKKQKEGDDDKTEKKRKKRPILSHNDDSADSSWWFVEDSNPTEIVFDGNGDGIEDDEEADKDLYSTVVKKKWW